MRLQSRDIAEALGLVYCGTVTDEDNSTGVGCYELHRFMFEDKNLFSGAWNTVDDAWEEVSEKLLEPLKNLLRESL